MESYFLAKPVDRRRIANLLAATRGSMLANRRLSVRVQVRVTLEFRGMTNGKGEVQEISVGGLTALIEPPPALGSRLVVVFRLPGDVVAIETVATVLRIRARVVNMGFELLSQQHREKLRRFITGAANQVRRDQS